MSPTLRGLVRHPDSYADPAGAVYRADDKMLRGIGTRFADFYLALLGSPVIRQMFGLQIVETDLADPASDSPDYPLVLQQREITPVSYCYEWPGVMLKDAALLTLDLCLQLAPEGLTLQDASPWNIVYDRFRPLFVDFTSIVPEDPQLLWVAYEQFCRLFLFPLVVCASGLGRVTRTLLRDPINGISDEELVKLIHTRGLGRLPWLLHRTYLPRLILRLVRRVASDEVLVGASRRISPSRQARVAFFRSLRRDVQSIPLRPGHSRWSSYQADLEAFQQPQQFDHKQSAIAGILDRLQPATVLDIGCNRGGYAVMAACKGARVTAFDADEDSIALLYAYARDHQLAILPLVMDLLNPSPPCGWLNSQFASARERFHAELVLALALVHHLAISQRQTWERIVPALAEYADRWLVTEFVPLTDPRSRELLVTNRRDLAWYTLEAFQEALARAFGRIELFPSNRQGRVLLLCTR